MRRPTGSHRAGYLADEPTQPVERFVVEDARVVDR
jgi:hypothetical protein